MKSIRIIWLGIELSETHEVAYGEHVVPVTSTRTYRLF